MTSSATRAGITLVGEIVDLEDRSGTSNVSVRWLGVTVDPAGPGAVSSFIPPQRDVPGPEQRPDLAGRYRPGGLRGLAGSIRRLIDGPQGRHRRPHH